MTIKTNNALTKILIYSVLIIAAALVLIPVLWMISTSLKIPKETFASPPSWIPKTPTLAAYNTIWNEYPFPQYFRNSIVVTVGSLIVTLIISSLTGYGLTRFRFRGKESIAGFILITQMFPSVMLLIPYYTLLGTYGLNDSLIGLMIVYISFKVPFCSWMMVGYFKTVPLELDEAARIDGCSRLKTFWKVVLPMTLPGLAACGIYGFITSWNEYMFANLLMTDPLMKTVPVGIATFNGNDVIMWNELMGASVLSSMPLVIAFLFMQKYFISGLTAGAVKS